MPICAICGGNKTVENYCPKCGVFTRIKRKKCDICGHVYTKMTCPACNGEGSWKKDDPY
jgi:DnaJ-class molecular chaperone